MQFDSKLKKVEDLQVLVTRSCELLEINSVKGQMLLHKIFAPIVGETEPLKLLHLCILSNKWITITQCDSDSYLFLT